jgi:oxygen-independent coproporphyrinogen-3 oxidase
LEQKDEYLAALKAEIMQKGVDATDRLAETIYLGGGTPSLLEPNEIEMILGKIGNYYRKPLAGQEITIETNPEDITEEKLEAWRKAKINRISIGVQTLNDQVRKTIGRRLTKDEVIQKIKLTINYFSNLSVDLIAGLPGDDIETFKDGIKRIYKTGVNHISLYDLELDNDCEITKNKGKFKLLTEKEREIFLTECWKMLGSLGYEQYEISNFSYDKKYSKHNLAFWNGHDYTGFGLGAASRLNNKLITNSRNLKEYLTGKFIENETILGRTDQVELNLMLVSRLNQPRLMQDGLHFYQKSSGVNLEPIIKEMRTEGLMDKNSLLTSKGKLLYNYVIDKLLAN